MTMGHWRLTNIPVLHSKELGPYWYKLWTIGTNSEQNPNYCRLKNHGTDFKKQKSDSNHYSSGWDRYGGM